MCGRGRARRKVGRGAGRGRGAQARIEAVFRRIAGISRSPAGASYKLPRIIDFHDEPLPKTGTGKIRKLILREQFWAGKEKRVQG